MEAVLAIDIIQEPQSNLEEKINPSILKDDFSSRTDLSIFTSIAPVAIVYNRNFYTDKITGSRHLELFCNIIAVINCFLSFRSN